MKSKPSNIEELCKKFDELELCKLNISDDSLRVEFFLL